MTDIRRITHITQPQMHDLCVLLEDCVDDGTSVGFLAPLTRDRAEAYWRSVQAALTDGPALFVAEDDGAVVGSVQLAPSPRENGRHRAEVQKLFVLRSHRGRGIGSRLMRAAEDHARSIGRMLLVLDTHQGAARRGHVRALGLAAVRRDPQLRRHPGRHAPRHGPVLQVAGARPGVTPRSFSPPRRRRGGRLSGLPFFVAIAWSWSAGAP